MTPQAEGTWVVLALEGMRSAAAANVVYREAVTRPTAMRLSALAALRRIVPEPFEPAPAKENEAMAMSVWGGLVVMSRGATVVVERVKCSYLADDLQEDWSDYGDDDLVAAWNERFRLGVEVVAR